MLTSECCSKSKVDIVSFQNENNGDAEHDLSQIRSLFVDGMKINNAPKDYIQRSLQLDLNDTSSMSSTYFSGRGTILMLVEDEDNDAIPLSSNRGSNGNGGDTCKRRNIKGIVGLQDVSSTTGTDNNKNGERLSERPNLCELRRMSIHSSCRRLGYGAKLVQECIHHAKGSNFDGIKLYTGGWMEAAIKFYIKMGFEDRGRLEYKNGDGSVTTIAHLELIF